MSFLVQKAPKLKEGRQFTDEEFEELPEVHKEAVRKALKWEGAGFDLRTHVVEPKSGILLAYQPYKRICNGAHIHYVRKDEKGVERRYTEQGHLITEDQERADRGAPPAPKESKAAHGNKTVSV